MSTIQRRELSLSPAIDRLKAMAAQAGDALLTEGPVHPDAVLLDLCADIAHARKVAEAASERRHNCPPAAWICKTASAVNEMVEAKMAAEKADKNYSAMLRAAGKIKATTAAGIYAKAIAVRSSQTGARLLATSMAEDLLACPGLRASLWPSQEDGL
jgi:hypothetical protein